MSGNRRDRTKLQEEMPALGTDARLEHVGVSLDLQIMKITERPAMWLRG